MIFTILATYKFKSGTATLNYEVFDAIALINECIEETKSLAVQKGIEINVFTETPDGCNICADKIHIKRVIMNLLANAINYAHKNSIVKINAVNDRGYFRFYVENSGEYIENEIIKQLFKKYSSFASKYKKASVGLGLYLSRKIIEAHCGAIKAEGLIDDTKHLIENSTNNTPKHINGKNIFSFYIPSILTDEIKNKKKGRKIAF